MVTRRPVVFISGQQTELPPGDFITGASVGTLTAGSGLDGGGDLGSTETVNVSLAPNASGLIFVDDKYLASDGVAQRIGEVALASGVYALEVSEDAVASGTAGSLLAATALASGNAALTDIAAIPGGTIESFTAASAVASGYAVGLDDTGSVQSVREVVDADSWSFGSAVVFESATSTTISATYDSTNNRVVIAYQDVGNSSYGTAIVGTVSGTSISFGTAVVFESADSRDISTTFDSTNNRVVIAYRDVGNSSYGTAIVGTVSGTSISFGTAVVFESAYSRFTSSTYDTDNNRVVIVYSNNITDDGTAIVGTVSGTSISFGSSVIFESARVSYTSTVYDFTNNKVVIAYTDGNNSDYGTSIIGTVSGTSISFGTAVVFESASCLYISAAYDSVSNRIVINYGDFGNSSYGTSIVGTVSGTSISFGAAVVFESAEVTYVSSVYDSDNNRIIIVYGDSGNSGHGTFIVGAVSGTTISFSSALVFESANSDYNSAIYDSFSNQVVIAYSDVNNLNYGTATVAAPGTQIAPTISSQNNFIGIAQDTVVSGTTVPVRLPGSYDQNNQGLVVGSLYYVDPTTSGFTTTVTQPSAWSGAVNWAPVGVAVNSTTLLLTDML